MTDHDVQLWTLVASAISAGGTVAAAIVAFWAARAWRDGLRQQRSDEFVAALNACGASIGRTITRKLKNFDPAHDGLGVDEAWASWGRLRSAYAVAHRYYPGLGDEFPIRGDAFLKRVEAFTTGAADKVSGDTINEDFGRFSRETEAKMR